MLYDSDYVTRHAELIGPLELALAAAKSQSGLPSGLTSHLEPRLQRAYGGSYRSNLHTRISATIDHERKHISWVQHVSYRYMRNPADTSGEPEVTFGQIAEIPPALREEDPSKLMTFGTVFLTLRVSVRNAVGGTPVTYEARRGRLMRTEAPAGSTAPPDLDLSFAHDPEKHELAMAFALNLPEELRTPEVLVDITLKYLSQLEDGVSFVRVTRLTEGYHLFIEFSPRVRFDLAEFEWKVAGMDTATVDKTAGEVHLPGWLLPGNGVAIAWNGTKEVPAVVNNQLQAQPEGMVRRMLGWLPWNRR